MINKENRNFLENSKFTSNFTDFLKVQADFMNTLLHYNVESFTSHLFSLLLLLLILVKSTLAYFGSSSSTSFSTISLTMPIMSSSS